MSNTPEGHDTWTVTDDENRNVRAFDTRSNAEEQLQKLADLGADVTLHPPDESAAWQYHGADDDATSEPSEDCAICGSPVAIADARSGPKGAPVHEDCRTSDGETATDGSGVEPTPEPAESVTAEPVPDAPTEELPDDPNLTDDPFAWMPGDFVDEIDGTPTINRRGYAALGRKFGINAPEKTVHVGPEDTDHTYCRVEATVVDDDGREYVNHGSAHVDRGDDSTLLLELATTRARKRALAGATGIGLIAVEELRNEIK